MGKVVDVERDFVGQPAHTIQCRLQASRVAPCLTDFSNFERYQGELLPHLIVKAPGDPRSFCFLRSNPEIGTRLFLVKRAVGN
jgi:hypothetical protein